MHRRDFLRRGAIAGSAAVATTNWNIPFVQQVFELEESTIADLQRGMHEGRWTARMITQAYLARIEELDQQGPALHSILETNPDALAIADELDRERRAKGPRGPLHGIPVLLKDNLDTADRMTTTAGSLALEGSVAAQDSTVAKRLREAGAVLLAKTNLSEWANFRSEHGSSGWSARGGQCRNPYVLDRNPCGSSSGSGAATSANLGTVSIGTETDGSIVCPSSSNGLVGLKPTVGLVSRVGIIPISHTQDGAGPMVRTVTDAAIVLSAIAGADPRDSATSAIAGHAHPNYTKFLDAGGLKGARIGVARQYFEFHRDVDTVMEEALVSMKRLGAELIDPIVVTNDNALAEAELLVLLYEFKRNVNGYLASLGVRAPVKNLAELINFNEAHRLQEMPYFGQELFVKAEAKGPLTSKEYVDALKKCRKLSREKGIDEVMTKHRLDAIVGPTGGPAWLTDVINGDHIGGGCSTLAAVAGYPHITVPAGYVRDLPVGLSLFGRAWSEPVLLRLAFAFEQATKHRHTPKFRPTLDL
ncbi:MAG: amidase [Acidobacteria bacterium]|nr:MAG: amidase [Acidobacteriota bacterium]